MSNRIGLVVALGLSLAAGAASAQGVCPTGMTRLMTEADVAAAVRGKTLCASRGGESWAEHHRIGGALWDYKKGPNDPVDPSTQVGAWEVVAGPMGNALLRHRYGGSAVYDWAVCTGGGGAALVSRTGETITGVRIVNGNGGC